MTRTTITTKILLLMLMVSSLVEIGFYCAFYGSDWIRVSK
jgi:hypothetical protein